MLSLQSLSVTRMYTLNLMAINIKPMRRGLFMVLFAWYCVSPAMALISNRTIDDGLGDSVTGQKILFLPTTQGVWSNQDCIGCALNPDTTKAFGGTYTAATYNSELGSISATLIFQGTAIYVFFILANSAPPGITTLTAVNFTLDGQPPVPKLHAPSVVTSDFQYDVMMWSQTGLPATQHTLVVSTSGVDNDVYVNFDYAIYTHDDEVVTPPVSPSSTRTPSAAMSSAIAPSTPMSASLGSSPPGESKMVSSITGAASATNFSMVKLSTAMPSVSPITTTFLAPSVTPFPSTLKSDNTDEVSSSHRGAIAGGALLVLAFVLAILYVCRRYRQRTNPQLLTAKPIISNTQGGRQILQSPLSVTPFPNISSRTMLRNTATFSEDSKVFTSEKSGRTRRLVKQSSPLLSYAGTNDTSAAVSPPHSEDLRRVRQEELNYQLAARQEAIRKLSSDLDSITNRADSDISRKDIRRVSVKTLRRLRSLVGHDAPQQEGGGSQPVAAGDFGARGAEGATEVNVAELQELNRSLRLEIEFLKLQQQSAWAQGLSDDPPPGYTPSVSRSQQA